MNGRFQAEDPQAIVATEITNPTSSSKAVKYTPETMAEKFRWEERFRTLVGAIAQIVWITNADGEFVTEQPSWERFTGQTFEEYKGSGWLSTMHSDDSAHVNTV